MTTGPKVASDMAERKPEPLRLPRRGEAIPHPFPDPGRLMGVLGPVIQVLPAAMLHRRHQLAVSDLIAGQLVGHNHPRHLPQAVEQPTEKPLSRHRVAPRLHQDVEHVAVLVDRAPQLTGSAVDLDKNLVEVPLVAGAGSAPAQLVGIVRPELGTPGADRLVADHDTAGPHQLLDVTQGQRKTVMQPHRVPDNLDRIPIALCILPRSPQQPILAAPHQGQQLDDGISRPVSVRWRARG
jgi:hypothetical protein